jgi:Mn2+/Fe2+ NRAMP family transporter
MMADHPDKKEGLRQGLPMVEKLDQEALRLEVASLQEINARPGRFARWRGYWKLSGPGWLQSAVTLGAGSAASSIFAGSVFGYRLLWIQPVSMFLGIIMFAAIGKQVLVTRARPYDVFWKTLHPSLALFWGFNVLLASIVWQFPQYSLGTAVMRDILDVFGLGLPKVVAALLMMGIATAICWGYGKGRRKSIRLFEKTLRVLVLIMVAAFLGVVIRTGVNWGELIKGYFGFYIPGDIKGITIVLGAFYAMPFWLPVLASSFNLIMLPIAYICFFILQNRKVYMGQDRNRGRKGSIWNTAMLITIAVVVLGALVKILSVFGVIQ